MIDELGQVADEVNLDARHARGLTGVGRRDDGVLDPAGDSAPEREALLQGVGYGAVRYGYAMLRPSVDDLPDAPLPAGLEIREVLPEHLPAIWAADQEAFSDAWGFRPATDQD